MNLILWAEQQKSALIDAGVNPLDAERAVQWVVDNLPSGEDPDTWIPAQRVVTDAVTAAEQESISDAKASWYADDSVPQRQRMLLDAMPVNNADEMLNAAIGATVGGLLTYLYRRDTNTYHNARTLRPVPAEPIRKLVDTQVTQAENYVSELAAMVDDGQIAYSTFLRTMQTDLKRLHLNFRAVGAGGFSNLTQVDFGKVDAKLMDGFRRLDNFVRDFRTGEISVRQAQNRAQMYVGTARIDFFEARQDHAWIDSDWVEIERRVLRPAEHCEDCLSYNDRGWVRAGTLPPPGVGSACKSRCKCYMVFHRVHISELADWLGTKRRVLGNLLIERKADGTPVPRVEEKRPAPTQPQQQPEQQAGQQAGQQGRPRQQQGNLTPKQILISGDIEQQKASLQWQWVHGSNRRSSIALKETIRQEFKTQGLVMNKRQFNIGDNEIAAITPAVRSMYEQTQAEFAKRGITEVTLYRGVKSGIRVPGVVESWTTDLATARKFNGHDILTETVPVSRIFMWHEGPGWKNGKYGEQYEYMVMGSVPR